MSGGQLTAGGCFLETGSIIIEDVFHRKLLVFTSSHFVSFIVLLGMNIRVPSLSGFCPGVKKAEEKIFTIRRKYPERHICILGYLIHNRKYIDYLSSVQIKTIENPDVVPKGAFLGIRTHGINRFEEEKLKQHYEIIDLTCRCVKNVQNTIEEYSCNEYAVLIIGKKHHPEVMGLESYAHLSHIIENSADLKHFLENAGELLNFPDEINKLLIISQTTGSRELFIETENKVKTQWPHGVTIQCVDSICPATNKKEEQALELQQRCDISFVIGDPLSSNARKLYKRLCSASGNVHFIEDVQMLKSLSLPLSTYTSALVVSSASTPIFIENEVITYLKKI